MEIKKELELFCGECARPLACGHRYDGNVDIESYYCSQSACERSFEVVRTRKVDLITGEVLK